MIRRRATDGSLLPTLPWTLAALAVAMAPHVQYLPPWITIVFFGCAAARWQIERKRWRLPPAWLRIALPLSCFVGVFASFDGTISGVGPGSALLAVMAALKLLETRQRRDQFVLLFISIFLVMASLLREQYLWSLPYLAAALAVVMTAWLRLSTAPSEPAARSFVSAGRLLVYAAPLCLAMWIFFPRIATPFWSVPIDTSASVTGLSDRMSPGDISSLSRSDAVAFRVKFEGSVPEHSQLYWRGLVLYRFNGRTWTGREPGRSFDAWERIEVYGDPVHYEITMEPTRLQWIYALDVPYGWSLENAFMGRQQQLWRVHPVDQRIEYGAVSYPHYRIDAGDPYWLQGYAELPEGGNPRAAGLAREMRRNAPDQEAYIADVLRMFHEEEFFYTLEPPALGRDPVDEFLFETRRGFCEHYASAFAVLMRAAGIPARIVLGYHGGEFNPVGRYLIVRQSDAHAWTEVWLAGRGWVRFDPTAAVAPERIVSSMSASRLAGIGSRWGFDAPSRLLHRLVLTWDALNARWNEWILGYGPETQNLFMRWLGMDRPTWKKMLLTLVAVAAGLTVALSYLLFRRYRPPPKDPAARLYGRFTRKAGVAPVVGETPGAYGRRLAGAAIAPAGQADAVIGHYLAARYGPPDGRNLEALRRAVERFAL